MAIAQPHEIFGSACRAFGETLRLTRPDDWSRPTPCADWDVRALSNHLVSECAWVPHLLSGGTVEDAGDRFEGDLLGEDPIAAWDGSAAAAIAAVDTLSDVDQTVHLSYGEEPAAVYLSQLAADFVIHRWDLATGLGQSSTLDPAMVEVVAAWFDRYQSLYLEAGVIDPPLAVPDDADPQTKLLARFGRAAI